MGNFGLFSDGFVAPTLDEVRSDLEDRYRAQYGQSIPLGDGTFLGFTIGVLSEAIHLVWAATEQVNSSQDPDKATGDALKALCLLTGTLSIPAAPSRVEAETLCGDDGTIVAADSLISTASTGRSFATADDATITLLNVWVANTPYVAGVDRVSNSARCYECVISGTSDPIGSGPASTADDILDGTAHWTYLGEGLAAVDVLALSVDNGPVVAFSRDLTVIQSPVAGWKSARNLLDAKLGNLDQTDESLRLLREAEVALPGTGTAIAIRAELLKITGVTSATVFYNDTDVTDVDGVTPHSVECLVRGGANQDIWDALLANVDAGIATVGSTVGTSLDDEGVSQTVKFSRPTEIAIYETVTLTKNPTTYSGDDSVKLQIATYGNAQATGRDAVASASSAQAFVSPVTGVGDVVEARVYTDTIAAGAPWVALHAYAATPGARSVVTNDGRSYICITTGVSAATGGPTGTGTDITDGSVHWRFLGATIPISTRQLATWDTSRLIINSSDATP